MLLVCPSEGVSNIRELFRARWNKIAHHAEILFATGNHLSCITAHIAELAAAVRQSLDESDPPKTHAENSSTADETMAVTAG